MKSGQRRSALSGKEVRHMGLGRRGRAIQADGIASAKVLRQRHLLSLRKTKEANVTKAECGR